ncbi:MAG: hypothetical protein ACR2MK_12015 [Solirubrobacteraceae bacterium]
MKLYVCYGTWTAGPPGRGHPCGSAHKALVQAGYQPEVIRSYGLGMLPGAINDLTRGRREVKELTGNHWVPALVTDDDAVVQGSKEIVAWARANPPASADRSAAAD